MFKLLAHFYRLDRRDLSLGTASWMLRVSFLASVCSPRFRFLMFAPLVLFSSLVVHSLCIFVLRVKVFSLHIINWASLVIFASVLRCDSQSFGPVYSFILFGLFARPRFSSNLANCLASILLVLFAFFSVCRIAIAQFCSYFFFTLYLFNFCFAVPL